MARLNTDTSGDVSDRDRQSIPSRGPATEKAVSEFCPDTRYVELAGVRRSKPATARNRRNSSSCVCDVGWSSAVIYGIHHKTELVTNPISDR